MTGIDIAILVIIGVSALISLVRGFFTEALSLATWVAALAIATLYAHQFGSLFSNQIVDDLARGVVAWLVLFFGSLLIGGLINYLFGKLRAQVTLSILDRGIGFLFGVARGVLVVTLIVLAAHLDLFTSLREGEVWNGSFLLPHFIRVAGFIHAFLPTREGSYFDFSSTLSPG